MQANPTFTQVRHSLKQAGMVVSPRSPEGEYRVAFAALKGELQECSAYYTPDLEDALLTGLLMVQKAKEIEASKLVEAWHAGRHMLAAVAGS